MALFHVNSQDDAAKALAYFNHFHDGFLESIVVNVTPENPGGFGFAVPVRHDVTLGFVHSNYQAAQSARSRIEMRMHRVMQMSVGNIVAVDNMLQSCSIEVDESGAVHLDVDGDGLVTFVCDELVIKELDDRN